MNKDQSESSRRRKAPPATARPSDNSPQAERLLAGRGSAPQTQSSQVSSSTTSASAPPRASLSDKHPILSAALAGVRMY